MGHLSGLTVFITLLALCRGATAGDTLVKLKASDFDKHNWVQPLVATDGKYLAVNDTWAAVGHTVDKIAQVSLFRLDAQGKPAGAPVVIKLPRSAFLDKRSCFVFSLLFHPKLPLLYAWQDAEFPPGGVSADDPALKDFDHLFVITLDGPAPQLALSLARGPRFAIGGRAGSLALDAQATRLYVPNLLHDRGADLTSGIGWFHLAPDGLPIDGDDEPPLKTPPSGDRAARFNGLRAALAANKPVGAFRGTPRAIYGLQACPCGAGILPIDRDVFLACGPFGLVTWNGADRAARANVFLTPVNFVSYYVSRMSAHPTLPVVYVSAAGYSYVYRLEHADGYITLAPQVVHIYGTDLQTAPVILTKRNLLAFGTKANAFYMVHTDAAGRIKSDEGMVITVFSKTTEALAYSERYGRLYVAVEKLK